MTRLAYWMASMSLMSIGTVASIDLPTQKLPSFGGSGGMAFTRECGNGRVLTGLRGREGMVVDAIGLLCRPVNASGALGEETSVGSLAGGGGGITKVMSCPTGHVVAGLRIKYGTYVDMISLHCKTWTASTRTYSGVIYLMNLIGRGGVAGGDVTASNCGSNRQPASGIHGRASGLVDATGLTCDEP